MRVTRRDALHHTYGEYLTWPEGSYAELINGTAYIREPPAPSRCHQEVAGELYHQLRLAVDGIPARAFIAPFDVRLPQQGEADELIDTVVQPDVLIVCDLRKLDACGMRGAPDWIAEVLSPSTASHDRMAKLPAYERAGVAEVWLIDPIARTLEIHRLQDGRYGRPIFVKLQGRIAITTIPGVVVDWDRLPPDPGAP
jgi:Uma2 family endonuclease